MVQKASLAKALAIACLHLSSSSDADCVGDSCYAESDATTLMQVKQTVAQGSARDQQPSVTVPVSDVLNKLLTSSPAKLPPKDLNVLAFNACWECQAGKTWATQESERSGTVAAIHCEKSSMDPASLVTSCSANVLKNVKAWHQAKPYDLAVFVDLCNPQSNDAETMSWGGFDMTKPDKAQCGLSFFTELKDILDDDRPDDEKFTFVLNQQKSDGSAQHALIGYKKSTFSDFSDPIVVKTSIATGFPLMALIFQKKQSQAKEKIVVIGLHSIQFRRALIDPKLIEPFDGAQDPSGLLAWAKSNYRAAGGRCDEKALLTGWTKCFSMTYFPTEALQHLFGTFIEKRIREGVEDQTSLDGIVRVIIAGDFQDETGELYGMPIFLDNVGKVATIEPDWRKRTCCAGRDERWMMEYAKWLAMTPKLAATAGPLRQALQSGSYSARSGYPDHSNATWDYLLNDCNYDDEKEAIKSWGLFGDKYGAENSQILAAAEPHSRYPFASDMILDTEDVKSFGFPTGYKQALGVGTMSDHDPVVATLPPLS